MRFFTVFSFLFFALSGNAQYLDLGAFLGASNYKGDLNERTPLAPNEYNHAIGLTARYNASPRFALKFNLFKGQVSGDDADSGFEEINLRNLNFRSDIVELSSQLEFNLTKFAIREGKVSAPYIFAGIGGMYFNPQAQMRGNWYDLQPLGTEGQGYAELTDKPRYSKYQAVIPLGLGLKFSLNHKVNLGLEFGARKTFTDYLDDVGGYYPDISKLKSLNPTAAQLSYRSPEYMKSNLPNPSGTERGNPDNKDWYYFMGLTISVNMTDKYGLDFDEKYDVFKTPKTKKELTKRELKEQAEKKRQKRRKRAWKSIKKNKERDEIKGLGF